MFACMDILLDFDGTVVTHEFPEIGQDIGAVPVLKRLIDKGHNLILFTMRCNGMKDPSHESDEHGRDCLREALDWFEKNGIKIKAVNNNPGQEMWTGSRKPHGNLIIDDTCLGAPIRYNPEVSERVFIDWDTVALWLEAEGII